MERTQRGRPAEERAKRPCHVKVNLERIEMQQGVRGHGGCRGYASDSASVMQWEGVAGRTHQS